MDTDAYPCAYVYYYINADAIAYRNGYRDNSANCNCGVAGSYAYCYIDEHGNTRTAHGYIDASGNIYAYTHPAANRNGGANYPHRASGDSDSAAGDRTNLLRQPDRQR